MASAAAPIRRPALPAPFDAWSPLVITAVLFGFLFARPAVLLARDWWNNPEAGHGLLLAPLAVWLAWRAGLRPDARPNVVAGALLLAGAVLVRYLSGLAAEIFTMRMSLVVGVAALVVYAFGFRQLRAWWLPLALLVLSIPLPEVVLGAIALPLQFTASRLGAALLEARHVPVLLAGNVIRLPNGHDLFVAEACSGLRSLTALLSLAVLLGGVSLRHPIGRFVLLAAAIPVAIAINGVRVFLTAFLVYFVSPSLGEGFMHTTEGWSLFLVAFAILGGLAWLLARAEGRLGARSRAGEESARGESGAAATPSGAVVDTHV
jgi:exosortase